MLLVSFFSHKKCLLCSRRLCSLLFTWNAMFMHYLLVYAAWPQPQCNGTSKNLLSIQNKQEWNASSIACAWTYRVLFYVFSIFYFILNAQRNPNWTRFVSPDDFRLFNPLIWILFHSALPMLPGFFLLHR